MKKVFIATAPAPGVIPGRKENEMSKQWNYTYEDLKQFCYDSDIHTRFSLISAIVESNGFVDSEDLQAVTCLYEEGYLEECCY